MSETTLASFTVEKEKWEAFKKLASQEGRSASNSLNKLIEQALYNNGISLTCSSNDAYITLSDFVSRGEFDNHLSSLKLELEELRQKVEHSGDVNDIPKVTVKEEVSKLIKEDDRRQEILNLMGYIPTCPKCATESSRRMGLGGTQNSQRFYCINNDCTQQTFTVYPRQPNANVLVES